jgi:hypothetical protein
LLQLKKKACEVTEMRFEYICDIDNVRYSENENDRPKKLGGSIRRSRREEPPPYFTRRLLFKQKNTSSKGNFTNQILNNISNLKHKICIK